MKPPFNAAMVIPTGIGCEIGGHAGDAGPLARLLAGVCDRLLLHPNVVNASDINEMPENGWYVEGSTLDRFFQGTIGLAAVHGNRILVVLADHPDREVLAGAINTVEAARATWGSRISDIIVLKEPPILKARIDANGLAQGGVERLEPLMNALSSKRGTFDAIAVATVIECPEEYHAAYFSEKFRCNPWGKAEAILTRYLGQQFDVPVAHAPMIEDAELLDDICGIVEPRKAAEAISYAFFHSVLKGLARAPKIVSTTHKNALTVEDIDALIIPDECQTPGAYEASKRGIPIISITQNDHLGQRATYQNTIEAENALEAAGILLCLKHGIDPNTVLRPIIPTLYQHT